MTPGTTNNDWIRIGGQGHEVVRVHREPDGVLSITIARNATLYDVALAGQRLLTDALDRLLPLHPADPHSGVSWGSERPCWHTWPCPNSGSPHRCTYGQGHLVEVHHCPCGATT